MSVPVVRQTSPWPRKNEGRDDFSEMADELGSTLPLTIDDMNVAVGFVNNRVLSAEESRALATQRAGEAGDSAALAGQKAAEAVDSAALAGQKASEAVDSAQAAADRLAGFDDRYLGAKPSDPTMDNAGNPLVVGALYFNPVYGMRIWAGAAWATAAGVISPDFTIVREERIAGAGQTQFPLENSYAVGLNAVMVYLNGARLRSGDYEETNSGLITLTAPCEEGDEVLIEIGVVATGESVAAGNVSFNPGGGLTATNVQAAVVEIGSRTDNAIADMQNTLEADLPSLASLHAIALSF